MMSRRIEAALAAGTLVWPEAGTIGLFGAGADDDLSAFPDDRVEVIQGFKPDHDALVGRGVPCRTDPGGPYAMAVVRLPRSRAQARLRIAAAAAATPGGAVLIDGQKSDGVDAILREMRDRAIVGPPMSKAHGKLFEVREAAVDDWASTGARLIEGRFRTIPGVFSADGIDPASAALAASLPARMPGRTVDLGAGWGYLADAVLGRGEVSGVDLVEADHAALACARASITDSRARFHWADVARYAPDAAFDWAVTNPPFHTSRRADPAIGQAFIAAAARVLRPSGRLWLVANRHLPYERTIASLFGVSQEVGGDGAFKIIEAAKPRRARP